MVRGQILEVPSLPGGPPSAFDHATNLWPDMVCYFGPSVVHTLTVYENSLRSIEQAMWRLVAARKPEVLGLDEVLTDNQRRLLQQPPMYITSYLAHIRTNLFELGLIDDNLFEFVYGLTPHPKYKLRLRALLEQSELNNRWHDTTKFVVGKLKRVEDAKPGKRPRQVIDMGVPASLRSGGLVKEVKHGMTPYHYRGLDLYFVSKPDYSVLKGVFELLVSPPHAGVFVFFSDDSCYSYRHGGRVIMGNCDITSCDGSNTIHLFNLLIHCVPPNFRESIEQSIAMLKRGIKYKKSWRLGLKKSIIATPTRHVLYSGSTLTTVSNNLANACIALHAWERDGSFANLSSRAQECGYLLTLQEAPSPEQLQFLKCSPSLLEDGSIEPQLNFGVILRAIGRRKRYFLHKKLGWYRSGVNVNCGVVASMRHAGDNPLTLLLRKKYPGGRTVTTDTALDKLTNLSRLPRPFVHADAAFKRYTNDSLMVSGFLECLGCANVGVAFDHPLGRRIMSLDYGVDYTNVRRQPAVPGTSVDFL